MPFFVSDCSLRACSAAAELKAESKDLSHRLAETLRTRARIMEQLMGLRRAAYPGPRNARRLPSGDPAGGGL
jgi:hypothetical protein